MPVSKGVTRRLKLVLPSDVSRVFQSMRELGTKCLDVAKLHYADLT